MGHDYRHVTALVGGYSSERAFAQFCFDMGLDLWFEPWRQRYVTIAVSSRERQDIVDLARLSGITLRCDRVGSAWEIGVG